MKSYNLYVVEPNTINAAIFVFDDREQCDDVRLQFLSAKYICWIKEVNDAEETDLNLS